MTSQKRYRHQHDNDSSGDGYKSVPPRFKPPRFKRQKSSSSPIESLSSDIEKDSQTRHSLKPDSPQLNVPILPAADVSRKTNSPDNIYQFKDKVRGQLRSGMDSTPTKRLSSHAVWPHSQSSIDRTYISSSWDDQGHMTQGFQGPTHVALGTHFGYESTPSPLYSWTSVDTPYLYGKPDVTRDPVWTNINGDHIIHHPSSFIDNNNTAVSGQYRQPYDSSWDVPSPIVYPVPAYSPVLKSSSPVPAEVSEKLKTDKAAEKCEDKQVVDYSDPDLRTIEMLRELERVADQKESEDDGFGVDRKSLVSHHLRMLMCAVDRYTEGIEDYLPVTLRPEEVQPVSDSRGSTPDTLVNLGQATPQKQAYQDTISRVHTNPSLLSPTKKELSVWNPPSASTKTNRELCENQEPSISTHELSVFSEQNAAKGSHTDAWDLWSSPSFDFCHLLTNYNSEVSTSGSTRERRPLYQRQNC